jgi:hypothetical protein
MKRIIAIAAMLMIAAIPATTASAIHVDGPNETIVISAGSTECRTYPINHHEFNFGVPNVQLTGSQTVELKKGSGISVTVDYIESGVVRESFSTSPFPTRNQGIPDQRVDILTESLYSDRTQISTQACFTSSKKATVHVVFANTTYTY